VAWIRSYLSDRRQCVLYEGRESEEIENNVGAPQGSVISPFLFLILTADMEEVLADLKKVFLLIYADDSTIYCIGDTEEEVRAGLEAAADRVLDYMATSGLSANPDKTKFLMFSKGKQDPIRVGEVLVDESGSEKLVGFVLAKDLKWKKHLEDLTQDLKARTGILRRLSWHLSEKTRIICMNALFTSKLCFGLEMLVDPFHHKDPNKTNSTALTHLQVLQNDAARAALGVRRSDKISQAELLKRTGQMNVSDLALRATMVQAWSALGDDGCGEMSERVECSRGQRATRQKTSNTIPPQTNQDTLLSRICLAWNSLPDEIKKETDKEAAKRKIKRLFH